MIIWGMWNLNGTPNVPMGVISGNYRYPYDNGPMPTHKGMNKDDPDSIVGQRLNPNGLTWYALAEDVATRHSALFWNGIIANLNPRQKALLFKCCASKGSE